MGEVVKRFFPDGFGTRSLVTLTLVGLVAWTLHLSHGTEVFENVVNGVMTMTAMMIGFWARDRQAKNGDGA